MAPASAIAGLEDHLGYWLRIVSNAVSMSFARRLEAEDVTVAEWVVLRVLLEAQATPPSKLAARLGLTRGAISKLEDRLLEKRLIERADNPEDGRAHTLGLSAAGRRLLPRLARHADANDAEFFAVLKPADRETLRWLLQEIAGRHGITSPPLA